jgi:hypothetical protein
MLWIESFRGKIATENLMLCQRLTKIEGSLKVARQQSRGLIRDFTPRFRTRIFTTTYYHTTSLINRYGWNEFAWCYRSLMYLILD